MNLVNHIILTQKTTNLKKNSLSIQSRSIDIWVPYELKNIAQCINIFNDPEFCYILSHPLSLLLVFLLSHFCLLQVLKQLLFSPSLMEIFKQLLFHSFSQLVFVSSSLHSFAILQAVSLSISLVSPFFWINLWIHSFLLQVFSSSSLFVLFL